MLKEESEATADGPAGPGLIATGDFCYVRTGLSIKRINACRSTRVTARGIAPGRGHTFTGIGGGSASAGVRKAMDRLG